jgi:hypothetical protein
MKFRFESQNTVLDSKPGKAFFDQAHVEAAASPQHAMPAFDKIISPTEKFKYNS